MNCASVGEQVTAYVVALTASVLQLSPLASNAQSVDPKLWVTSGVVSAIARSGNTLYIGGSLGTVGPATGGGLLVDDHGAGTATHFPTVTGYVFHSVPDGQGGWYIAGDFIAVGGVARNSLAHILADGSLSPWSPHVNDHHLGPIALSRGVVYFSGSFDSVGSAPRFRLAAVDAESGDVLPWDPHPSGSVRSYGAGGPLITALVPTGDTIFVAGNFTLIGGQSRNCLSPVDARSGAALDWAPGTNDIIQTALLKGGTLYLGGYFTQLGGQPRNLAGAVDVNSGTVTAWNPDVTGPSDMYVSNPYVQSLTASGASVYLGGRFSAVGGQPRSALAAVDTATGALGAWNPNPAYSYTYPYPYVWALAAADSIVFVGGSFDSIGGRGQAFLAAVDTTIGLATSWNPRPDGEVWSLRHDGSKVCVGGTFRTAGAWVTRHGLAALDLTTGAVKDWAPNPNGVEISALMACNGVVYAGGDFTFIGGQARSGICALDTLTGAAMPWNPGADGEVRAMAIRAGTLYVGGGFLSIGGQVRHYAAALDTVTGLATGWDPEPNDWVAALAATDSAVFLGGLFEAVGAGTRHHLAAVDPLSGAALPWQADADWVVEALRLDGRRLYVGGAFTELGGQPRNCLGAVDAATGAVAPWNPAITGSGVANAQPDVRALELRGHSVIVAGDFFQIGGRARPCLAVLDDDSGLALDWAPRANFPVLSLLHSGGVVYAGGSFGSMGLLPTSGLAAVSLPDEAALLTRTLVMTQTYPNPASTSATVRFTLPFKASVSLAVYDIQGRRVLNVIDHASREAGQHEAVLTVSRLRPGVYLCRLVAGGATACRKMLLIR